MGSTLWQAGNRGARLATLAGWLSAAAVATAEPAYTLEYVGDTTPGVPSFGAPTLQEEGPALGYPVAWDTANRRGLGCTGTSLTKYALDDTDAPMPVPIGILDIPAEERPLRSPVVDSAGGFAYCATSTTPARIVKFAFGAENDPPMRVGTLTLEPGEENVASAVIDEANGYAYFGTDSTPGQIVKVRLGDAGEAPTRVGALALDTGEDRLLCAVADPDAGRAYFGSATSGRIVTVDLGDGDALPTRVGALELGAEGAGISLAGIDAVRDTAYFGGGSNVVLKVATGGADAIPSRIASYSWSKPNSILVEPSAGHFYFGWGTVHSVTYCSETCPFLCPPACTYYKIATAWLGRVSDRGLAPANSPTNLGETRCGGSFGCLDNDFSPPSSLLAAHDPSSGSFYCQAYGGLHRVCGDSRGALRGSALYLPRAIVPKEMRFFSHAADGNLRFALYRRTYLSSASYRRHSHELLWESGVVRNDAANSYVSLPIALDGLSPGYYLLAWQTDSAQPVGSLGDEDSILGSCQLVQPFGAATQSFAVPERLYDFVSGPGRMEFGRWTQSIGYARYEPTTMEVSIDGEVVPPGGRISFGPFTSPETPLEKIVEVKVRNTGNAPLVIYLAAGNGLALANDFAREIAPGESDTVSATVSIPATRGETEYSGRLTLWANHGTSERYDIDFRILVGYPPEIVVTYFGDDLANNAETINFGEVAPGAQAPRRTFTVSNSGAGTLKTSGLAVPVGFSIFNYLSSSIAPGGSDTFILTMATSTAGTHSGTVSFATNDADENPFTFTVVGTVGDPQPPEIAVSHDGDDLVNGAETVDFGEIAFDAQAPVRTFTVSNSGSGTLTTSGLVVPSGFSVSDSLASSIAPGASDTFSLTMATSTSGTRSGTVSFATNDADENPFSFNVVGVVHQPVPEIAVSIDGNNLANNVETVDFGEVESGGAAPTRTFTVANAGAGDLATSNMVVAPGFEIAEPLAATIAPGASDTFSLAMRTDADAVYHGTVSFATNDADENPFSFFVEGAVEGTFLDAMGLDFVAINPRPHETETMEVVLPKSGEAASCDFLAVDIDANGVATGMAQVALFSAGRGTPTIVEVPVSGALRYEAKGDSAATTHRTRAKLSARGASPDGEKIAAKFAGAREVETPSAVDPSAASEVDGTLAIAWGKRGKGSTSGPFVLGEPRVVRFVVPTGAFADQRGKVAFAGDAPARVGDEDWSGGTSVGTLRFAAGEKPGTFRFTLENRGRTCRIDGTHPLAAIPADTAAFDHAAEPEAQDFRANAVRATWKR